MLRPAAQVLWVVAFGGSQIAPAGAAYWFDNRNRLPDGRWVVQASLKGTVELRIDGRTHAAGPGSLMLFRYGEDSQYGRPGELSEAYHNRWVALDGAGLDEHLSRLRESAGPVLAMGLDHPIHEALRELVGLVEPTRTVTATRQAELVHRFVMSLVEHVTSTRRRAQAPVDQAVDHLLEHPLDPLDTPSVAARFGVSREHLSRVFRQRTGQTPARYLETRRVNHALALLGATDLPLQDIARQAGMRSARQLADRVRSRTGRPPSALR